MLNNFIHTYEICWYFTKHIRSACTRLLQKFDKLKMKDMGANKDECGIALLRRTDHAHTVWTLKACKSCLSRVMTGCLKFLLQVHRVQKFEITLSGPDRHSGI